MKTILTKIFTTAFILTLAANGFASKYETATNASENQKNSFANYRAEVPQGMLETDFRWWQPENPVPFIAANINDIMMTDGYRIYYNPQIVSQVPLKIQAFFLAHEYGHIIGRTSNEFLSDQFASRVYAETDISVVKAAVWHFYNIQGGMCSQTHGCGWQRAENIARTAGFSYEEYVNIIRGNF